MFDSKIVDQTEYSNVQVLLIEDNPGDARLIREYLKVMMDFNHDIDIVSTLSEGVQAIKTKDYGVILLDLSLPDSSGIDTIHRINSSAKKVPIVVLTGLNDLNTARKAVQAGAQDYLVKDQINSDSIVRAIFHAIDRHKMRLTIELLADSIQKNQELFKKIIENNADSILIVDKEKIIRFINPAAEIALGKSSHDLIGREFGYVFLEKDKKMEITIDYENGNYLVGEIQIVEIEWEGEVAYLLTIRDVSERNLFEKKLLASEKKYREIFENSPISIWDEDFSELKLYVNQLKTSGITNLEKYFDENPDEVINCAQMVKIVDVNQATLEIYKANNKDEILTNLDIVFIEESYTAFKKELIALVEGKKVIEFESKNKTLKGNIIDIRIKLNIMPGYEDSWSRILLSINDITEQKKIEAEKIEKKILGAINEILVYSIKAESEQDLAIKFLEIVERVIESEFGFIAELNEKNLLDCLAVSITGWEKKLSPKSQVLNTFKDIKLQGMRGLVVKNDKTYIVNNMKNHPDYVENPKVFPKIKSFLGVPLKTNEKTIGLIAIANKEGGFGDVDKQIMETTSVAFVEALMRKKAEVNLRKSEINLRKLLDQYISTIEYKSKFFASMSHDLRTPLNAIIGFSEILLESVYGNLNSDQTEYLNDIKTSAYHLLDLINTILDFSKVEAGKFKLNKQKIEIKPIIHEIYSSLKPLYEQKNIMFYTKGCNSNIIIEADPLRLKQVLYNILDNAVKFTNNGSVFLELKQEKEDWKFLVKDTGIGIEEKDYEVVFREFGRIENDKIKPVSGSGIGLALTKRLIELHGGKIWFDSEPGKGTTFYFNIPKNYKMK